MLCNNTTVMFAPLDIFLVSDPIKKSSDHIIKIVPRDDVLIVTYKEGSIVHKWSCSNIRSYLIAYIRNVIRFAALDQDTCTRVNAIQINPPCMPSVLFTLHDKSRTDQALEIIEDHLCFLLADINKNWPTTGSTSDC